MTIGRARVLTDRQATLLILVDEATKWPESDTRPGTGDCVYFVPSRTENWCAFFRRHVRVSGGDGATLRMLERRGWIAPHPTHGQSSYWYRITEEGILQAEKEREKRR